MKISHFYSQCIIFTHIHLYIITSYIYTHIHARARIQTHIHLYEVIRKENKGKAIVIIITYK